MRKLLFSFLLLLLVNIASAQERKISGTVTDASDGSPVPGVTVKIKGTSKGTQTNVDGRYTITVGGSNDVIVFTSIGYTTREVAAGNALLNIKLVPIANQLNEVVVVSYGTANKKTATGSVNQVKSADIEKRPITNVLSAVVGSAPGVSTTVAGGAAGSSPGVRIRGFGSISGSSDALILVDGAIYDGGISNINPDDVESVSILKDAATTALYGSRAANGVLVITTKKGKPGKATLDFKVSHGWMSRGLPEYNRVDAYQYYPLMWEAYRNSLVYGTLKVPMATANSIASGLTTTYGGNTYSGIKSLLGYNPFNVPDNQIVQTDGTLNPAAKLLYPDDLDWAGQTTQGKKERQNYNMSYSGANEKTDYFGSFGYTREQGYLINSDYQRYNGRLNVNTQATKWFKTGMNLAGSYAKSQFDNAADGGTSIINPFYTSRFIGPIYPVHLHDATGALVLDQNGQSQYDVGSGRPFTPGRNTVYENLNDSQNLVRGAINSRAYATINFYKDLKFTTNIAFDLQDNQQREYDNPNVGDGAPSGRAYQYFYRTTNYTFNQLLEYNKDWGKHHIDVLAGHENNSYKYNYLTASKTGIIATGNIELANFSTITGASSYEDNATVESYLSRLNYDFDERFLLSASLRRDGNSRFAPDGRWANFWSVGGGWNISRESFFKVSWIDQLKLRSSYGVVGNSAGLGYYPYQALYLLGRNNGAEAGYTQNSLPNPNLSWETAKNFDIGADFSLFKGRLGGSVEYFNRVTDGLIFSVPVALSNGGTYSDNNFSIPSNVGSLYNKGFELNLNGTIVKNKNFNYSVNFNITHISNKITKMPPSQALIQNGTKAYAVGHSIYDFYLRDYYGVDPQTGAALYRTNTLTTNAKVVGADTLTTVVGEANYRWSGKTAIPDVQGSMSHTFSYKNFSLGVMFTYQLGGKVYDTQYAALMHAGTYGTALSTDILKRWQNPGDVTNVPRLDNAQLSNFAAGTSTRWLTSASYLQLNSANFAYAIPKQWLNKLTVKSASLFVSGENLALFSARKGMNVSGAFNGTTDNTYNFNRIISVGLNASF